MGLLDALDRFLVQLCADGRSEHTRKQYDRHVRLLANWLASEGHSGDVDELSHELLARFLAAPQARTTRLGGSKKPTSMNALRSSLRAFFSYCRDAGWCRENPARLVRRARCSGPPPRGLSDQDRQRLLDELTVAQGPAARRDHMWIDLLLNSGMRLSAALRLQMEDVDFEQGVIIAHDCKNDRIERVILPRDLLDHLRGYCAEREPGYLFVGRNGQPISRRHAARRLSLWLQQAGCKGASHPHALRHTFATRLLRKSGNLGVVQRALGHRAITSTTIYIQVADAELREALGG